MQEGVEEVIIDRTLFFSGYRANFGSHLTQSQVDGLENILRRVEADAALHADLRWVSYSLATIKHECADTWQPVEEVGKGRGHEYGKPINGHAYYGRGYVQLTWLKNYQRFTALTGVDLVTRPDQALRPDVAWVVLSHGMREGLFTGKRLSDYISGAHCDYRNARRIINGTDRAALVAGYATRLELVLRAATGEASFDV